MSFFESLSFSSANEDSQSELRALEGAPNGRLLCLTGSGARALDMTLGAAEEIISLDLNPMQNRLLRLKIAAFTVLDYQELLAYLGVVPSRERLALHARVGAALPTAERAFWEGHAALIRRGIWYGGLWEKLLRIGSRGNRLMRGRRIDRLFATRSLEEQAEIWQRDFDDRIWRGSLRLLGRRWIWTRLIGEPGGAFLPSPDEVESRLGAAFARASESFLFSQSDFASLILRGRHEAPMALPLHLQERHFERVRDRIERIRPVSGGLSDMGGMGLSGIGAFSLSDFGSYCSRESYDACWKAVLEAAAPGARFVERIFMNPLFPRSERIETDTALSEELTRQDRAIIYQIRAGRIAPTAETARRLEALPQEAQNLA